MEKNKDLFKKYHSRVVRNGILKSLLLALIAGFAVMFVVAFLSWVMEFSAFIALAVGLGIVLILTPVLYLVFFKPTSKAIVRLVDKLGLEERAVTMYELEHDDSYIAMLQREDAKAKLQSVNAKMMSFRLSKAVIISACVLIALGLGMTALSQWGPSIGDVNVVPPKPKEIFDVVYEVRGGGFILGEVAQKVEEESDGSEVLAVEDDGYCFTGWTWFDERGIQRSSTVPLHKATEVKSNLTITAIFEPVENADELLKGQDGEGNKETPPRDPTDSEGGGGGGDDGSGDEENPGGPGSGSGNSNNGVDQSQNNTVIDGQTDYTSEFDWVGQTDELNDDDTLPPEIKDAVADYFDRIKP